MDRSDIDIYARYKDNAWWLFYGGTWWRLYTHDAGIPLPETAPAFHGRAWSDPYAAEGLTSYKSVTFNSLYKVVLAIEYDKASA